MCVGVLGDPVLVAQLKQGLQEIISDTRPAPNHPVGYLTTMKRFVMSYLRWPPISPYILTPVIHGRN